MINHKKFAIYCSGNASRVVRFYTDTYNLETFFPNVVIYDGDSKDTLSTLLKIFQQRLKYINFDLLNDEEKRRINTYTSQFIFRNYFPPLCHLTHRRTTKTSQYHASSSPSSS